ncbi:MFS transporter [Oleispirillum naphthae]|uniref:MFS transporter n=1 Tax=Oleispirillum naphthae TaxID=2838853 RepID=UPI003082529C
MSPPKPSAACVQKRRLQLRAAAAAGHGLPAPRRYFAWATIIVGLSLAVLDGTIANVALPTIAAHFHAGAAASIWIVNGYQLAIVMTLLPLAALGEIFGYRVVYLTGIALFTVASVGCVLAESLAQLTAARIVQGLGAAGMMSVNIAVLRHTVAREKFGAAVGINALVVAVASTVGPAFAGFALAVVDWRWLFAVNIPLGIITVGLGIPSLPDSQRATHRFDWPSAVLSAAAIGLIVTSIDSFGHNLPWYATAAQILACVPCFVFLVRRARSSARPMLPLDLLRIPAFTLAVCTSIASFATQLLAFVALPFLFQLVLHYPPEQVGLMMMPWPLAVAVVAPLAGRMSDAYPPAILGGVGLALLALGMAALGFIGPGASLPDICWRMALCGLGFGLFQAPNNRAMFDAAPMDRSGAASGMLGTARLTGQSIGAALVALMLGQAGLAGANGALFLGTGFATLAAITSLSRLPFGKPR